MVLPIFKLETTSNLKPTLKSSGLKDIFNSETCDVSNLTNSSSDLLVSMIAQKAIIEVNEEGTEAAAATDVYCEEECYVEPTFFRCNIPFIYAIIDELTELSLFSGRVVNPKQN